MQSCLSDNNDALFSVGIIITFLACDDNKEGNSNYPLYVAVSIVKSGYITTGPVAIKISVKILMSRKR